VKYIAEGAVCATHEFVCFIEVKAGGTVIHVAVTTLACLAGTLTFQKSCLGSNRCDVGQGTEVLDIERSRWNDRRSRFHDGWEWGKFTATILTFRIFDATLVVWLGPKFLKIDYCDAGDSTEHD
jgi:hypothetical protein